MPNLRLNLQPRTSANAHMFRTRPQNYVSADRLVDRRSDQPYYAAKIRLAPPRGAPAAAVVAGMPVQAFVKTGTGTAAGYALRPLRDSFTRAFRED